MKFRVWNEKTQRLEDARNFVVAHDGKLIDLRSLDPQIKRDCVVQWWTGLTDPQGVDIYEGDIVLAYMTQTPYGRSPKNHPCYFRVAFDSDGSYGKAFTIHQLTKISKGDYRTFPSPEDLRVIGPALAFPVKELLEGKPFIDPAELLLLLQAN